jgi:tetratricopeptide (TPR) repeat protein
MTNYRRLNNTLGWAIFAIAAAVYISTIEPTASFWDCGEYIACSHKLEVGHPPGAPLFLLLGRLFILFGGDNPATAAKWVNIMSALCSALTILFLFWTITAFAKRLVVGRGSTFQMSTGSMIAIMGSGVVGALAYTFSDSFWFSAVEGEVYAMSSFFTAIVFWAILRWEDDDDIEHSGRWIILISFLMGLSIGVHLLNLLAIPAIVFVYYFKNYQPTRNGILLAGILSVVILGGIQSAIIPGLVSLAASWELTFVNSFGMPFNSGTIIYFLLLITLVAIGILYTMKRDRKLFTIALVIGGVFYIISLFNAPSGAVIFRLFAGAIIGGLLYMIRERYALLNTILLSFIVLVIGYSSFAVLVIRSNANTPMDENNPENAINLLAYLNREQYGDWPIGYGQYYNSPLDNEKPYKDGSPVYSKDEKSGRYVVIDDRHNSIPNYDKEFCTVFPRMWSQQASHEAAYKSWGRVEGERIVHTNQRGERETIVKPTMGDNLTYFARYQVGWMYMRYFGWNFIGKQNDVQGHGNITDGNSITGIAALDGDKTITERSPVALQENKAHNTLYALPFILGVLGFIFHFMRRSTDAFVVLLLFFFTGLAIVVYLNQYPYQPRERDYAYTGSFYAFAIWIGLGVYAIYAWLTQRKKAAAGDPVTQAAPAAAFAVSLICLGVPILMGMQEWDDHDRSNRYTARDLARNYLQSCAPNAILFTNGDNDTFPLWYVQEVEGFRTDVRVVNLSLLQTDWYIDQMRRRAYESAPVPFSLTPDKYRQGKRDVVYFYDQKIKGNIPLRQLVDFVASDDPHNKLETGSGGYADYFPTNNLRITVDTLKVLQNKTISPKLASRIEKNIDWTLQKNYLMKNDLMVLDLLATNNWERPVYFAVTTGPDSYLGLEDYFQLEGLAYRLVPVKSLPQEQPQGVRVATDIMYDNLMNKFSWGSLDVPGVYFDENIQRMATNMRIQMGTLATSLIAEGKKDSAQKVLDKCIQAMPEENVPYDATLFTVTYSYYQVGAKDKAHKLAQRLFDVFEHDIKYYASVPRDLRIAYNRDLRQAQDVLEKLVMITENFKDTELTKNFQDRYLSIINAYPELKQQQQQ